ncbi:AbrB/MazE/SpoVT family DNA-binding domain-containing protein [Leptodesmis sichuanensis]
MLTSTITSKGQITIPKAIRDLLNLHPGDRIDFIVENG